MYLKILKLILIIKYSKICLLRLKKFTSFFCEQNVFKNADKAYKNFKLIKDNDLD